MLYYEPLYICNTLQIQISSINCIRNGLYEWKKTLLWILEETH